MGFWTTILAVTGRTMTKKITKTAKEKGKRGIKSTGQSINFMRAPKDSPFEMIKSSGKKDNITSELAKYLKDSIKIK